DVQPVDLVRVDDRYPDRERAATDLAVELLAHGRPEHLRVGDAVEREPGRKDDRGRDDGPRERSHAHLVDAGDVPDADAPEERLQVRRRRRWPTAALPRTAPRYSHPRRPRSKRDAALSKSLVAAGAQLGYARVSRRRATNKRTVDDRAGRVDSPTDPCRAHVAPRP